MRAGLIGLGEMGRHHARVLQQLGDVELVAIFDPALAPEDSPGAARCVRTLGGRCSPASPTSRPVVVILDLHAPRASVSTTGRRQGPHAHREAGRRARPTNWYVHSSRPSPGPRSRRWGRPHRALQPGAAGDASADSTQGQVGVSTRWPHGAPVRTQPAIARRRGRSRPRHPRHRPHRVGDAIGVPAR